MPKIVIRKCLRKKCGHEAPQDDFGYRGHKVWTCPICNHAKTAPIKVISAD